MTNPDIEIIAEYETDNSSGSCAVCGVWGASFRARSLLMLCSYCHDDTPAKCSREEFSTATGIPMNDPSFGDFWDDYVHSSHGDVAEYWEACST
jgi:hypothetical protein